MNIKNIIDYLKQPEKKIYLYTAILTIFLVVIIIIVLLFNILFGGNKSYDEMELILVDSAKQYYNKKDNLKKNVGFESKVKSKELINNDNMKEFKKYSKDFENCEGEVQVTYNGEDFLYTPILNCGKQYKTKTLQDEMKKTKFQDNGSGLYQVDDYYLYKGETPNNYVKFANELWRVLRIENDGTIRMIQVSSTEDEFVFDNRYNASCNDDDDYDCSGFNDFEKSRLKEKMMKYYNDNKNFDKFNKNLIVYKNICVKGVSENITLNDGMAECELLTTNKYPLDFVRLNEVILPSLDYNCQSINDKSCSNYNFMNYIIGAYWTATPLAESNKKAFYISGLPTASYLSEETSLRFVVNLSKNTLYQSGTGTEDNPYIIKTIKN